MRLILTLSRCDELQGDTTLTQSLPSCTRLEQPTVIPGLATLVNVATVLVGAVIGVALGNRLPTRTRDVVTDALGLVTLLIAGTSAIAGPVAGAERRGRQTARRC